MTNFKIITRLSVEQKNVRMKRGSPIREEIGRGRKVLPEYSKDINLNALARTKL